MRGCVKEITLRVGTRIVLVNSGWVEYYNTKELTTQLISKYIKYKKKK